MRGQVRDDLVRRDAHIHGPTDRLPRELARNKFAEPHLELAEEGQDRNLEGRRGIGIHPKVGFEDNGILVSGFGDPAVRGSREAGGNGPKAGVRTRQGRSESRWEVLPVVVRWANLPADTEDDEMQLADRTLTTTALDTLNDLAERDAIRATSSSASPANTAPTSSCRPPRCTRHRVSMM